MYGLLGCGPHEGLTKQREEYTRIAQSIYNATRREESAKIPPKYEKDKKSKKLLLLK